MKPSAFLDTNPVLRHVLQDNAEQSPKSTAFLKDVEDGKTAVATSDTVVFETVFTLERHYHVPKDQIRATLLALFQLPGIVFPGKSRLPRVFDLYVGRNIPFADAYHAVLMEHLKLTRIATFDRDFDRIPGITRIRL